MVIAMPDIIIHYGFSLLFLMSMRKDVKKSLFLAIAGILPDFDVFLYPLILHRTLTHSFLVIWSVFGFLIYARRYIPFLEKYNDFLIYVPILMSFHVFFDIFDWYVAVLWPLDIAIWIRFSALSSLVSIGIPEFTFEILIADTSVFEEAFSGYIFWDYSPAFGIAVLFIALVNYIPTKNAIK